MAIPNGPLRFLTHQIDYPKEYSVCIVKGSISYTCDKQYSGVVCDSPDHGDFQETIISENNAEMKTKIQNVVAKAKKKFNGNYAQYRSFCNYLYPVNDLSTDL
jgi:hypothetical protein